MVFSAGRLVDADELFADPHQVAAGRARHSVKARPVEACRFPRAGRADGETPVIGVVPGQIITEQLAMRPARRAAARRLPISRSDIIKVAVIERHGKNGNIATGFVHGFGLKRGAIASTVGHDSHNICVVGVDDDDMAAGRQPAGRDRGRLRRRRATARVLASLRCRRRADEPRSPTRRCATRCIALREAARRRSASTLEEPFLQLAFLPLPVIPHLKITDKGLVDVDAFRIIPRPETASA